MGDQAEKLKKMAEEKRGSIKEPSHRVRVITITSGKGGVGKSNMTVNLALSLASKGKKVVVFDADFGLANVDILLGLVSRFTMYDVIKGEKTLKEIMHEGPMGIKIVPGSTGLMEMANLNGFQRRHLLQQLLELEENADIILIDTGAGISKVVLGFITAAHDVLLITNPEPTSITDAYGIAKVIGKYKIQDRLKLVVNQVRNKKEGQEVALRFSRVSTNFLQLQVDYLGCIVTDQVVSRAVREQQPFFLAYPNSKAAACVDHIASNLLEPGSVSMEESAGIGGFFTKIAKIFN